MTECPPLTSLPENSIIVTAEQIKFLIVDTYSRSVGTTVNVRCQTGLVLVGPSSVRCMQSGYWSADPYCTFPGTTSKPTSGMEESIILAIVLAVVGFLVAALIVFVCVAMFWGRVRRKRNKKYRDSSDFCLDDVSSQPYSISRQNHDNAKVYNKDVPQAPPTYSQEHLRQNRRHEPYPQYREREMEEMHKTADYDYDDGRPERRHFRYKCPHCVRNYDEMRHAQSLNDILDETQRENRRADKDEETSIRGRRRDGYLWRSRSSFTDMNIPRPYYEVSGLPHYVAYYGGNVSACV